MTGPMRSLASLNIRKFKTTVDGGAISVPGSGVLYSQLSGTITDIDNTAGNNYQGIGMQNALRSLYEEYRVDAIKFTFVPLSTQATIGGSTAGQVAYAINRAPWSAVPTSMIDILRQNDCKVFNTTRGFAVTVRKPHWGSLDPLSTVVTVASTGSPPPASIRDASATTKNSFISTRDYVNGDAQPDWFGMDLAINGLPGAVTLYRLYKTYYITFRNQT